jgi:poly(hydroxyalkanoate) granule-associated protein
MANEPAEARAGVRKGEGTMLKKAKAKLAEETAGVTDDGAGKSKDATIDTAKEMAQSVLDSSHQIWLAGLGAFSQAKQEGAKLFETLVKQGENLQDRTKRAATETAAVAREAATAKAKEMQQMAGGTWDKLEQVFEDRVARALSKLGVYTQNDVQQLAKRVDELAAAVNQLVKAPAGAKTAAPARRAPKRRAKTSTPKAVKGTRSRRAAKRAEK